MIDNGFNTYTNELKMCTSIKLLLTSNVFMSKYKIVYKSTN